jgi:hypothetical protein
MMTRTQAAHIDPCQGILEQLMDIVQDGTVLVGTPRSLAQSFDVSVHELRLALRDLLEAGRIAMGAETHGRITVRLERRQLPALAPLPAALERRRPQPDVWII